ncbi:MAG TPA: hypothetical protein VH372_18345 [Actinospica sp.]|nr:hypothetical protein [Actinospica sp.]
MASPASTLNPGRTLAGCARAATAAESRHRIDRPIVAARAARVIALDDAAASAASRIADLPWAHARFYLCEPAEDDAFAFRLREIGGPSFAVPGELTGTDVVVLVAGGFGGADGSEHESGVGPGTGTADYAAAIGRVCAQRSIMTAGVVLASGRGAEPDAKADAAADAVAALRPYARVLLPTADESDLVELLTALRV